MDTTSVRGGNRPLLILGRVPNGAELALRRVLRAKQPDQPLVVLDYQGTLAAFLSENNQGNLPRKPLLWCDLGNRRRPAAIFRFKRSPGMKPALRSFLANCARVVAAQVSDPTLDLVVELAHRLADQGTVGLASVLRALRRPEITHWFRRNSQLGAEVDRTGELLASLLRFPSVWSTSEGNNAIDLGKTLRAAGTVWIEIPGAHMERIEHQVACWMADAAIMDMLISLRGAETGAKGKSSSPIMLYGFPPAEPLPFAAIGASIKQVGVLGFSHSTALPRSASPWFEHGADCWVVGEVGDVSANSSTPWFSEAEVARLRTLTQGEAWVRSGADRRAVTMVVRPPQIACAPARGYRQQALRRLRLTPVKQFSSSVPGVDSSPPANSDLYRRLCVKENLFAGWLRVKTHNKDSHGADQITIEQFGSRLDGELEQVAAELSEGRYRCRPLRTVRIPKPSGEDRIIRIACVRDRVVQAACLDLLEPLFDSRFSPRSFAYRPHRGARQAIALARSMIRAGRHWAVTADIRKCFDSLDHDVLMRLVGEVIGDRDLLQLLRHWLSVDVIDFQDITPSELGVPQGEAISPLLANIYLDPLDKELERHAIAFVRYADDYLIVCATEAEAQSALRAMTDFLAGVLRLALKPAKSQFGPVADGVDYLGFQLRTEDVRIQPDKVARTSQLVGGLVDMITGAQTAVMDRCSAMLRINALISGFRNYFFIDDASGILSQLRDLDGALERRAGRIDPRLGVELAWASRERFTPPEIPTDNDHRSTQMSSMTSGYPLEWQPSLLDDTDFDLIVGTAGERPSEPAGSDQLASAPRSATLPDDSRTTEDVLQIGGRAHVMTSGCYATVNQDDLVIRRRKNEIYRTPLAKLNMLYLEGSGIAISADLTMKLCDNGIPVVFTPLVGAPAAVAQPIQYDRSPVRQQQVLRRNDPDIVKAGLAMLAAKIGNQASVLKYFARYRKRSQTEVFRSITRSADEIRSVSALVDGMDPSSVNVRAVAMGHEGRAAATYWGSLGSLVPADLMFPGRHTRHATDPVNSAINYVYGMLYGEVWRCIVRVGLDPFFGIIHGADRDQGSLVFDLIEEYRAPFGDRLVLSMIGRGFALRLDKEGRLTASTRQKLVRAFHTLWHRKVHWRTELRSPGEILERQAGNLKKAYLGEGDYSPFRFRW